MLEEALLREQFQALLDQERKALRAYDELMGQVDDPVIQAQLEQLRREKLRHVELTERLVEIVE